MTEIEIEQEPKGHTPGPWAAIPVNAQVYHVRTVTGDPGDREFGPLVADCTSYNAGIEPAANARLVAAAPDLLAALTEIVTQAESWHDFHHGSESIQCDAICAAIPAGRAAIAKATGQEVR